MLVPAAAASGKLIAATVLVTTALRFAVTALYQLTADDALGHVAGVVGLLLLAVAVYAAGALVLEDAGHPVIPIGRRTAPVGLRPECGGSATG